MSSCVCVCVFVSSVCAAPAGGLRMVRCVTPDASCEWAATDDRVVSRRIAVAMRRSHGLLSLCTRTPPQGGMNALLFITRHTCPRRTVSSAQRPPRRRRRCRRCRRLRVSAPPAATGRAGAPSVRHLEQQLQSHGRVWDRRGAVLSPAVAALGGEFLRDFVVTASCRVFYFVSSRGSCLRARAARLFGAVRR